MKLDDLFDAPSGRLHIDIFSGGVLVEEFDETNLIVTGSKNIHAKLLGGSVTGKSVTTIGFGTNGTAPAVGNTGITSAFTKAVDTVTYPATNQVQFNFSLTSLESNGKAIMEFGLLTSDGSLYARRVRTLALNKNSDISLTGYWIITF